MKYNRIYLFIVLLAAVTAQPSPGNPPEHPAVDRAKQHLYYLASDELKGRNTPSKELDKAAEYIAGEFVKYGVKPVNGSYFHNYTLQKIRLGERLAMRFKTPTGETAFAPKDDFVPFENTGPAALTDAGVVFVGYGVTIPELGYDDYSGVDVRGKIVVFLRGAPRFSNSAFGGDTTLRRLGWQYARNTAKAAAARKHGAVGCFVVNVGLQTRTISPKPNGFPWPSLFPNMPADALPLSVLKKVDTLIPVISIGENVINALFGSVDSLGSLQAGIEKSGKPKSYNIEAVSVDELSVTLTPEVVTVKNVVGMVEGADKSGRHVVIGAHYDHVGYGPPKEPGKDSVYNGADDNASGTTGLLLLAEKFAAQKPKRSIVFIAFSGEEKGLLGSKAYCDSPLLPLTECKAMFNMDMIGRNSDDSLSLGGNTRCKELANIAEEENKRLERPFTLAYNIEHFFFRSDQASFAMRKIPVLFFFSGDHADYHGLGDHADKINYPKLLRATELCGNTVWRVADSAIELPFTPQKGDNLVTE